MIENRIRETTDTVGTGPFALNGATDSTHQSFSVLGNGNPGFYTCVNLEVDTEFEIGLGTFIAPGTLQRTTVYLSSSGGSNPVIFSGGKKAIFNGLPKEFFQVTSMPNRVPRAGADGKIHSSWIPAGSGGGVTGPTPSTNDAIPAWVGTSGNELRDSLIQIIGIANDKFSHLASFGPVTIVPDNPVITLDLDESNIFRTDIESATTIQFDNPSEGQEFTVILEQKSEADHQITWPATVDWDNDLPPVLHPILNGWDIILLVCYYIDPVYEIPYYRQIGRTTSAPRLSLITIANADTIVFDLRVSVENRVILTGNKPLAVVADANQGNQVFAIKLTQDATGSRTVTWFDTIKWPGGSPPTLTTTPNHSDWFCFIRTGTDVYDCLGISLDLPE
jgi:hypothetical protein